MTCSYCSSRIGVGENRCRRCGRKPGDTLTGGQPIIVTTGNLAPKIQHVPVTRIEERPAPNFAGAVQTSLWPTKVVPIERYAPARPRAKAETAEKPKSVSRRSPRVSENQAQLDFLPMAPAGPKKLGTTVEAVIYCDAPVASPGHRALAAAFDWAMVLIGYGLFLLAFRLFGGEIVLNKTTLLVYGGVFAMIGFAYGVMWTIAGARTAGMHWTRLRLITFDGFPPDLRHRILRLVGSCLSYCTMAGLLWSLVDEESLTWQDHISRTFPTFLGFDEQTLRQR